MEEHYRTDDPLVNAKTGRVVSFGALTSTTGQATMDKPGDISEMLARYRSALTKDTYETRNDTDDMMPQKAAIDLNANLRELTKASDNGSNMGSTHNS